MTYYLGDVIPLSISITDASGSPANAGAVTLNVALPDGTPVVVTAVPPTSTGVYDHDFPTTQPGRHSVSWVATGANASAFSDTFDVEPADDLNFISLADARAHLRKTNTNDDAQLAGFVAAACTMIEDRIGPVAQRAGSTYFDHRPGWPFPPVIVLPDSPVASVTSVTVDGVTVNGTPTDQCSPGWTLEPGPGLLHRSGRWPFGRVTVTYRVGRVTVPGNVRLAALELVSHLWRSSQLNASGGRPGLSGEDQIAQRGDTYALPYRVRELLGLGKLPTDEIQVG